MKENNGHFLEWREKYKILCFKMLNMKKKMVLMLLIGNVSEEISI